MILALALACAPADLPADAEPGPAAGGWQDGADLPFPRQEPGVVTADAEVVVVAGVDEGPLTGNWVQSYQPVDDTWRDLPSLPVQVHHPNVVALDDGSILLLGALDAAFDQQPHYYVLPHEGSQWEALPAPPDDRVVGAAGVALLDGRVHLVGGLRNRSSVALHSVFDPADGSWEALPDAPSARDHLALGAIGDRLVAAAGRDGGLASFVDATEVWTEANGWGTGTPIPTPRAGVAAAVLDGRLHVFGGEGASTGTGVFAEHEAYDPDTNRWEAFDDMPEPRHGMGAAVVDDVIWIPGGAPVDNFGAEAVMQGFSL